ncbi:hypothetical protein DL93DRAFT_2172381 [Clavulina sp. PMI_390]|nr:hypothetical protein DL93DRAFT_2172381 [Clavulina sp. PMI_390]
MTTMSLLRDIIRTLSERLIELEKDESAQTYINLASRNSALGSGNNLVLEETLAKWTLVQSTLFDANTSVANEIRVLQTASARLHNTSRPAVALPNEILGSIFELANAPGWERSSRYAITATCYRWRNVAINTPVLWTAINLGFGSAPPFNAAVKVPDPEARTSLWNLEMGRSQSHPTQYQLSFKGGYVPLALHQQQWTAAVHFIGSHVEPCTYMDLAFWNPPSQYNFVWPSEAVSNLQHLELLTVRLEETFPLDLRKSQRLAYLALQADSAPPNAPPFQLQIPQALINLAYLSGWTAFGPEDLALIVESAPNLESLTISLRYTLPDRPIFTLEPLNRLKQLCVGGPFYWTVINRITAPLLSSLHIQGNFVDTQDREVEPLPRLSTQFPLLEKFDFEGDTPFTPEQLQPFVQHPNVQELCIEHLFQFARIEDLKGGPNAPFPRVRHIWGAGSESRDPSEASQLAPLFQSRLSEDFILHWIPSSFGRHVTRREKLLRKMAEKYPRHLKIEKERMHKTTFNVAPTSRH